MKAKPYKWNGKSYEPCDAQNATHVELHMPGPIPYRLIPVIIKGERRGTPCWSWNGDVNYPTLKPSILTKTTELAELGEKQLEDRNAGIQNVKRLDSREVVCHSWVNDGKVIFLNDCMHEFRNMTVDLLNIED